MSTKKKTAGAAAPNGQKENNANQIIAVPLDVVNMSDEEIITAAVGRLERENKEAKYDLYGGVLHAPVCAALSEFCRQNAEFAQAVCQSDKHFGDCVKAVARGVTTTLSDLEAYTRAVQFYFAGATISFKMLIDVGDGVLCDRTPEHLKSPPAISLDNLLDW